MSTHTPINSSSPLPPKEVTLDIPEEMSFLTPIGSPAATSNRATTAALDNLEAFSLESAIDGGEPLSEQAADNNGESSGEGGGGGEVTPTVAKVKAEDSEDKATLNGSSAEIPRRLIRTTHMEKCVPCQWLRKSCDKGNPCQQCVDTMKARDKQWECYYDPNFVRPTKNAYLPEKYRIMGPRHMKKEPKEEEEKESDDNGQVLLVTHDATADISRASSPPALLANPPIPDDIKTVSALITAMKADINFLTNISNHGEGESTRASAEHTIAIITDKLNHPKLQVYLQQEHGIMEGPLSEGTKQMLIEQNFKDCLKVERWR